jgi:hypothetical protein
MVQDMKTVTSGSTKKTPSGPWKSLVFVAVVLAWLGIHEQDSNEQEGEFQAMPASSADAEPEPSALNPSEAPQLSLGDWQKYPETTAEQEWTIEPLDGERWAQVSAELACAGRRNRGDPDAHEKLVRNICAHHRTSLAEVSSFSTRLNQNDASQAHNWAVPISEAVKSCR